MIVYYDSHCPFCQKNVALWSKLDWFNQVTFTSFRDLENYPENMAKSIHVYTKGTWIKGYAALIEIMKKLPILWPFLPLGYIIKYLGIGEWLYHQIASRRKILPSLTDEVSCSCTKDALLK